MPASEDDKRPRTPEEHLKTIAGLFVDFFEGEPSLGGPCLGSIVRSLETIARSAELLTGWAGAMSRMDRFETRLEFITNQQTSVHDLLVLLLDRIGEGAPSPPPEDGS